MAFVGFLFTVVVYAHKEEVVGVLGYLCRIFFAVDLGYRAVGILVVFQFKDDGRRLNILARDEHEIGKALA